MGFPSKQGLSTDDCMKTLRGNPTKAIIGKDLIIKLLIESTKLTNKEYCLKFSKSEGINKEKNRLKAETSDSICVSFAELTFLH